MQQEVYMALGGDPTTKPATETERLDKDWLNGGLALIRAYTEATLKDHGFSDIKIYADPFNMNHKDLSLTIEFNTANVKGCRNARHNSIVSGLKRFEDSMLDINGTLNRNLRKDTPTDEMRYTLPLDREFVPKIAGNIKKKLASQIPVSAYLAHLNQPKR